MTKSITLPYACLRALVLFPGTSIDLAVGRSESKEVIRACRERFSNKLVVVTQKRAEQGESVSDTDVYQVGTVCEFEATIQLENLDRVRVAGMHRVKLQDFRLEDKLQVVTATPVEENNYTDSEWNRLKQEIMQILEPLSADMTDSMESIFDRLKNEQSHYRFISNCLDLIKQNTKRTMNLPTEVSTPFPEDEETQRFVNDLIGKQQRVLEEPEAVRQLELLRKLSIEHVS